VLGAALALAGVLLGLALLAPVATAAPPLSGAIFTTLEDGTRVNANIYQDKRDVYLDGGPGPNAPKTAAGLPDGNYYFQVTDPPGKTLLSTDPVKCREFRVAGGVIVQYLGIGRTYTKGPKTYDCYKDGKQFGMHDLGVDVDHSAVTIQLMPYDDTPNKGGVYKAWATPTADFLGDNSSVDNPCGNGCFHGFLPAASKTDNFKAKSTRIEPPRITVRKFIDTDGDGVWDAGEPEVGTTYLFNGGGWPVHVTDPNGAVTDGFTPFTYLAGFGGNYLVCEEVPAGWGQTAAFLDGVSKPVNPCVTVNVAFTSGETHEVVFGNFDCFTVSGKKINDLDGDGVADPGEPGIAGWRIDLYRNGGVTPYATTSTGPDGSYSFTVCVGGNFEVREETRAGWNPTSPTSIWFVGQSGVDRTGLNFLNFGCFTVSGKKINDLNGNGVVNGGETGLAGWTIRLYRNGELYDETTTNAQGEWSFTVCEGGYYEVWEEVQDDWVQTAPPGGFFSFTAVSDTDRTGLNFLNFELFDICGEKWLDENKDGVHNGDEDTIAGWKIELWRDGTRVATAFTNSDGRYCFTDLGPGNYEVREVMPNNAEWLQTFPGGDGDHDIPGISGADVDDADFGNVCIFTEGLTWGYWKTHTGYDAPPRDPAYDLLPANPMPVDVPTADNDYLVDSDAEAQAVFELDSNCSGDPDGGKCRGLFRVQLLALHMNLLKFADMGDAIYVNPGDPHSGDTVQEIYDDAVALLTDGGVHDFTDFQGTLDSINNNGEGGDNVLVCANPPHPEY
jgi:hypothetical protein